MCIRDREMIKITYFKKDETKTGGCYLSIMQSVKRIDELYKTVILNNQQIIAIEDIYDLEEK